MSEEKRPRIDLQKVVAGAQLPALPQSAIRLLELSQDPKNGPAEFSVPIESDPGLTGQVLKFVNSSYFGFSREISSVKLAITLVGIRTIKNFALWSAVFSLMPNPKCGMLDLKGLWQDSLRRALFARAVSKMLGLKEAEEAFSAALLQDMAIPVLAKEAPAAYKKLLQVRSDNGVSLSDLEQRVFGWTHAEAGGLMARQWNLPDGFAVLIENHLEVDQWTDQPHAEPAKAAVALSRLLPTAADSVWHDCQRFSEFYQRISGPGDPSATETLNSIDQEFADFAPVLKLSTPAKSLVDIYEEALAVSQ